MAKRALPRAHAFFSNQARPPAPPSLFFFNAGPDLLPSAAQQFDWVVDRKVANQPLKRAVCRNHDGPAQLKPHSATSAGWQSPRPTSDASIFGP